MSKKSRAITIRRKCGHTNIEFIKSSGEEARIIKKWEMQKLCFKCYEESIKPKRSSTLILDDKLVSPSELEKILQHIAKEWENHPDMFNRKITGYDASISDGALTIRLNTTTIKTTEVKHGTNE